MTLRDRPDRPGGYPTAAAFAGLGVGLLAFGEPPFNLFVGAASCLTGIVAAYSRYHRGAP